MTTTSATAPIDRHFAGGRSGSLRRLVPAPELGVLLVLSALLSLWALGQNGLANEYYSAAVRSMSESWSAFSFGTFDQAGVMTVDKPPLALWVQAGSVRVFGYSTWSMLVPQALMFVAAVALTYDLVKRPFGRAAGLAGGLVLALTPVSVAIARHNNPDALLVLCSVAASWAIVRGLEDGRTRWLVLSGVMIGLGFEAKMAAALLVLPGAAAAWMWVAPRGRLVAVRQLLAGGAAMTATALAWPVAVWLIPAGSRPWISGTSDNSIWSLILGYNGLGRLFGQDGGPGGGMGGGPGGGGGGGPFGGQSGLGRLWNDSLGGQAGWLLGGALVTMAGLVVLTRLRRSDPRTGWLIAVGGTLAVTALAFSTAQGIFHPYYVSQLAPFAAAGIGALVGLAVRDEDGAAGRWVVALGITGAVIGEIVVLNTSATELGWAAVPIAAVAAAGATLLVRSRDRVTRLVAVAVVGAAMLAPPAAWSVETLGHATSSTFPAGGPASAGFGGGGGMGGPGGGRAGGGRAGGGFGGGTMPSPPAGFGGGAPTGGGMGGGDTSSLQSALTYAAANGGGTVAVSGQNGAASQLIAAGESNVVALGGFSGRESQVTVAWLADAVESGKVRWVLTSDSGGMGGPSDNRTGARDVLAAAAEVGTASSSVDGLVDLQGKAAALRVLAAR
ncbi:MAG: glycosyltransferase family 39 protein [Baekduia sp.]